MLEMTAQATDVVREIRTQRGLPDDCGLRLFPSSGDDGQQMVRLGFADEPAAGDHVTGSEDARLFVAAELADLLEDSVLDVEGVGDERKLVLHSA